MCGICGFVSFEPEHNTDKLILQKMNGTLRHRGPDDEGYYQDSRASLAMRRLSIIDLRTGQQPISNEAGDIWVVYNGEIYNFQTLRTQLEKSGHIFKTKSDTEIVVHAYEEYGDDCLKHFNGMFALALWDARKSRLLLARDHMGIKPLYYWAGQDQLVFGSELKALIVHPDVPRRINPAAIDLFLSLEYIPSPLTIYENVFKLPPGHRLVLEGNKLDVSPFWDVPVQPLGMDEGECAETLAGLMRDAVGMRMISDVPLGAFLSGGIDSSSVVGFMSQFSSQPVQTFSIGFQDASYNELPYAEAVARHFGTEHHVELLAPDVSSLAEELVRHHDEPFADTSIFPTYLVSKLARQHVKVALSGDGGDELFGGYDTYRAEQLSRVYAKLPKVVRRDVMPAFAGMLPPQPAKKGAINKVKRMIEGASMDPALQHTRWMIFMNDRDKDSLYQAELKMVLDQGSTSAFFERHFQQAGSFDTLARQQYVDMKTYLADDILTKVDRMSMAVSLEARVPLLDHRIVEFALNLPPHMKLNRSRTKIIMRRAVKRLVPDLVIEKPKEGFSIPMKHWLGNSLKSMMLDLLSNDTVRRRGYFNPQVVSAWIQEHLDGRVNHSHRLWALMVLELWHLAGPGA
jgi:asparagine synthase (glutamine-hydrolysing)